jgi:hypothetical protein
MSGRRQVKKQNIVKGDIKKGGVVIQDAASKSSSAAPRPMKLPAGRRPSRPRG